MELPLENDVAQFPNRLPMTSGVAQAKPDAAFDGHRHCAVVGTFRLPAEAPFERIDCGLFRCGSMRSSSLVSARLILERASLPNATGVPESACRSANVICSSVNLDFFIASPYPHKEPRSDLTLVLTCADFPE